MEPRSICAVVVTFNPDSEVLMRQMNSVIPQVDMIVVIDNSETELKGRFAELAKKNQQIHYVRNKENIGLAAAQNQGIRLSLQKGFEFTVLFDQDSIPEPAMIDELVAAYVELEKSCPKLLGVGPCFLDPRSNLRPRSIGFGMFGIKRSKIKNSAKRNTAIRTEFLISSGYLFRTESILNTGLMDEGLFIEHIDTEWCLRARKQGYTSYIVPSAKMTHCLGARVFRYWFFGWRNISLNLPKRNYYIYRNSVLLYKRKDIYWKWKYNDMLRLIRIFLVSLVVGDEKLDRIVFSFKGIRDGIKGVTGKIPLRC